MRDGVLGHGDQPAAQPAHGPVSASLLKLGWDAIVQGRAGETRRPSASVTGSRRWRLFFEDYDTADQTAAEREVRERP